MKVADYIIKTLENEGIKEVFLVYGAANGDLVDAFTRCEKIKYICTMHEQAAGFAAEGYSRVNGKFGVAITTGGPGGQNLITSIANCYYESIPVLFITGQPNSKFMKKTKELRQNAFQEDEIYDMVKSITKYSVLVTQPDDIKFHLLKALFEMKTGRPGPVLLNIPLDIQKSEFKNNNEHEFAYEYYNENLINQFITTFIEQLSISKRPVLLIGGGVKLSKAEDELYKLINTLKIPVFPTYNAIDTVACDNEYYCGRIGTYGGDGRNFAIQNADLLLSIGSRISGRIVGGRPDYFMTNAKKFIVDIDGSILKPGQHDIKFDYTLKCDANFFINQLNKVLSDKYDFSGWLEKAKDYRDRYPVVEPKYYKQSDRINPYVFVKELSKLCTKDDIIVADCGGNLIVTSQAFDTKTGQLLFSNNSNSPMGFSLCGAIGAWFASNKKGNVICIIGDGGMNMNIQELQTIKNYGINLKIFIMNNHVYGITKAFQELYFDGKGEACGPKGYKPPDFIKISKAYGLDCMSIENEGIENLQNGIKAILNNNHTTVVDVNCHNYYEYTPRVIGWNTSIENMYPYLSKEEFIENMLIPIVYRTCQKDTSL